MTRGRIIKPLKPVTTPQCPYCGSLAPFGDARHQWMRAHLDSRWHRFWWFLRRPVKRKDKNESG